MTHVPPSFNTTIAPHKTVLKDALTQMTYDLEQMMLDAKAMKDEVDNEGYAAAPFLTEKWRSAFRSQNKFILSVHSYRKKQDAFLEDLVSYVESLAKTIGSTKKADTAILALLEVVHDADKRWDADKAVFEAELAARTQNIGQPTPEKASLQEPAPKPPTASEVPAEPVPKKRRDKYEEMIAAAQAAIRSVPE